MNQYFISISFDSQPEIQCMPLEFNAPGLGLNSEGITWCEQSDALLYINAHNELMIKCIGNTCISIERCGRKSILKPDHPLHILSKDIITIGETTPHTFHIHHIYRSHKSLALSKRLSKLAMIAFATSIVMTCTVSCNRPEPNNPTDAIQSSESTDPSEADLEEIEDDQLNTPGLMGLVFNPDNGVFMKDKDDFVDEIKSNAIDSECPE